MSRYGAEQMVFSAGALGQKPPSYLEASILADRLLRLPTEYSNVTLMYNRFQSAIAFVTSQQPVFPLQAYNNARMTRLVSRWAPTD